MSINMYVINAILVLMVIRQVREHQLGLRALAIPVLAVAAAAVVFLHSVPGGGNDIALELAGVLAGAAMGAVGGLATHLRRGAGGRPLGRAGWLAAGMWIGVGARMAFAFAATHGASPAIGRFSIAHDITGSDAWVAALVMMALADVLTRLVVVYLRGRRLAADRLAPGRPSRPAPVPDLPSPHAAGQTVSMRARLAAAGLVSWHARSAFPAAGDGEPASARVARGRSRARERGDRRRQALLPLGWVFIAVVVTASAHAPKGSPSALACSPARVSPHGGAPSPT